MQSLKLITIRPVAPCVVPTTSASSAVLGRCFTPLPSLSTSVCRCVSASVCAAPSAAEVSRTITALLNHGTLSTLTPEGRPLGTHVTFVLDSDGSPILRLRADAVHTANLRSSPACTIFVHSADQPLREVGRVTLIGSVEPMGEEDTAEASARHAIIAGRSVGVDAPQADDVFMRFTLQECFYVAGLGVCCRFSNLYHRCELCCLAMATVQPAS